MNKIAAYLNEHLLGEVSGAKSIRKAYSTDGSVLSIAPEIVAFPRLTSDIRKIARFTWQLAEKGHGVPVTIRGFGGDTTGGAIGKGIVIDTTRHLDSIIQVATKDKLVHVQAGISLDVLNTTLKWQGLSLAGSEQRGLRQISVGGAIAGDSFGIDGSIADSIEKLEVILANGDVIETGKLSKREVNKKLGLQTFEGEIYRKIEGLFEDNEALIATLADNPQRENTGYRRIAEVRSKDGSINLTPLFIGSQGTLGIISEAVLRTEFFSQDDIQVAITAPSLQDARDLADKLAPIQPSELTIYDGELLRRAVKQGSKFSILGSVEQLGAVVYVRFGDLSERAQNHKFKKLRKVLGKSPAGMVSSLEQDSDGFTPLTTIRQTLDLGSGDDTVALPVLDGASIPANRQEEFEGALRDLAHRHHVDLPLIQNALRGTYSIFPLLKLDTVSDKQKLFKLMSDYAVLVNHCGGAFITEGAEGRLKANAAWSVLSEEEMRLYTQIRHIFDPFATLNPGVKQKAELRTLVAALRTSYDSASVL